MGVTKDLTGQRFHRLTVKERTLNNSYGKTQWICTCDCGQEITAVTGHLVSGNTKSCGCQRVDSARENGLNRTTHGMTRSPEYKAWQSMKDRCYNPDSSGYENYGGRGITVCDRWKDSFETFYADMGPRPSPEHSIDREKVDGRYEPDNCRWTTIDIQNSNKRTNVFYDFMGEKLTIHEIARRTNIPAPTLKSRVERMGLSIEYAVAKETTRHQLTYQGQTRSLTEWSKFLGIPYGKLYMRLWSLGWSVERAFQK